MKWKLLALLLVAVLTPALCEAQTLKAGTWTGSIIPPEGDIASVTFDVTMKGDSLGIVIHAGEHGDFTAEDARYTEGKITFVFHPGPRVACTLSKTEEGSFTGPCIDEEGGEAKVTMVPPKE
jgi:hypothetical protein